MNQALYLIFSMSFIVTPFSKNSNRSLKQGCDDELLIRSESMISEGEPMIEEQTRTPSPFRDQLGNLINKSMTKSSVMVSPFTSNFEFLLEEEEDKVEDFFPQKANFNKVKKNVERRLTFDERALTCDNYVNQKENEAEHENADPNTFRSSFLIRPCPLGINKALTVPWRTPIEYKKSLETTPNRQLSDINTINYLTLGQLLKGPKSVNKPYLIIDCRFNFEYKGGHINGAINITDPMKLERIFFTYQNLLKSEKYIEELKRGEEGHALDLRSDVTLEGSPSKDKNFIDPIVVFHCEFSKKRGPKMYRHLRKRDRELNEPHKLSYPDIYLLEGGYEKFHKHSKDFCVPQGGYIPMNDKCHMDQFIEENKDYKNGWRRLKQNKNPLHLTRTFSIY